MKLAMIGLGRMGANLTRRLMHGGHECVVYDLNRDAVAQLEAEGAIGQTRSTTLSARCLRPAPFGSWCPRRSPTP
jgi:6-phosphogluconate dehydrogenase